jgi:hypothetical protein
MPGPASLLRIYTRKNKIRTGSFRGPQALTIAPKACARYVVPVRHGTPRKQAEQNHAGTENGRFTRTYENLPVITSSAK